MPAESAAASVPRLSRRHVTGGESARTLLFTILGEFVLPDGGTAWTSAFISCLGRLGVEEKAARQALMRTAADGWLTSQRHGRRTSWTLTPTAEVVLTDGTRRIYGFRAASSTWDGRWLLVLARTPETERPMRHRLRTRLRWAGFGTPAPGVWVSTHPERLDEATRALAESGVSDAQVFVASHAGGGPLEAMVREAWDLAAVEVDYEKFLAEFEGAEDRDPLRRTVELVHAWRRFPALDPELPRELLPSLWNGTSAAELFLDRHSRWTDTARAEWARLNRI